MLNTVRSKNLNCDFEAKFIQERITTVERNIAEFCNAFSLYSRKAARLRDKGDEIAKISLSYSESEDINKSLSECLANFASSMSTISDYGNIRVLNIDNKVVNELTRYENICKQTKNEVKQIFSVREKEMAKRRQLDRVRERNASRQHILQAETELVKATAEVSKTIHSLEEEIVAFEKQKLYDIKSIFLDFISTEIGYHAKALELLTTSYQAIEAINETSDLQDFQSELGRIEGEFKKSLRMPEKHLESKRQVFRSVQSFGSITSIFSASNRRKSPGIPNTVLKNSKKSISKSDETIDSIKTDNESDEISTESEDENTKTNQSEEKVSPFIAKKYLK